LVELAAPPRPWRNLDVLVVSPTPTHPQDHGNRKRIYEVCSELKRQGARIHFVYYPGEHDWRRRWPLRHEAEMAAAWDSYHLVAPSRPLHEDSIGRDHTIDEWADPSLTAHLAWACGKRVYDVAIVNYTWMSFCLDAIPSSVFKILDTHDAFGTRRELFEARGLAPEFFHTTRPEEAKGLKRADLVWAIKPGERDYFERELGVANALTLLHAEPERGWWQGAPSTDGWLRAGVIGARNTINKRNLEEFLAAALPIFHRYMAPVKIVVGGGCSDDFPDLVHPNVEIVGRVPDVADFYRSVDVAIAPVQFSTGLKIKVAEALASGAPVIAHAHAMEGFPARERLHRLPSFEDMALELVKLSFDRAPLAWLASCSRAVCEATRASALQTLNETQAQFAKRAAGGVCIVAPMAAFDTKSVLHEHLKEAVDYLRFAASLTIYVVGEPVRGASFDVLYGYDGGGRLFAEARLMEELGPDAPDFWIAASFEDVFAARGIRVVYVLADAPEELTPVALRGAQTILRGDAIEAAGGDADALVERLRGGAEIVVVSAEPRWRSRAGIKLAIDAPMRRSGSFDLLTRRRGGAKRGEPLLILARDGDPIAAAALRLGAEIGFPGVAVDPRRAPDLFQGFADRRLVVDLTDGEGRAGALAEIALHLRIPRLALRRGAVALGLRNLAPPLYPTTVGQLLRTLAQFALDPSEAERLGAATRAEADGRFSGDVGWCVLWRYLHAAREAAAQGAAAAALWG